MFNYLSEHMRDLGGKVNWSVALRRADRDPVALFGDELRQRLIFQAMANSAARAWLRRETKSSFTSMQAWDSIAPDAQWFRICLMSFIYLTISSLLFIAWPPSVPARGLMTFWVERVTLALAVGLYVVHLMYCLDTHFFAIHLADKLRRAIAIDGDPAGILDTVRRFGRLTSSVSQTLLYPATILTFIIVSRLQIFDNWTMPISMWITLLLGFAILLSCALLLNRTAARLRQVASFAVDRTSADSGSPCTARPVAERASRDKGRALCSATGATVALSICGHHGSDVRRRF